MKLILIIIYSCYCELSHQKGYLVYGMSVKKLKELNKRKIVYNYSFL